LCPVFGDSRGKKVKPLKAEGRMDSLALHGLVRCEEKKEPPRGGGADRRASGLIVASFGKSDKVGRPDSRGRKKSKIGLVPN